MDRYAPVHLVVCIYTPGVALLVKGRLGGMYTLGVVLLGQIRGLSLTLCVHVHGVPISPFGSNNPVTKARLREDC